MEPTRIAFELHSQDFPPPLGIGEHIHERLASKLEKLGRRVVGIEVHLKDVAAAKGLEKACHIETRLAGHGPVNVEERATDLHAAVDLAIERTVVAVHRQLERTLGKARRQVRKIITPGKVGV
jgi:ribosome-associated translation inhibitor RaiA